MDILSHGLYGSIAFGRRNRKSFWLAFFFGIAPDLFSFGIFFAERILGFASGPDWKNGPPDPNTIPSYVDSLYNITHSLIIFAIVFGFVWLLRKKPLWEFLAWPLHILVDIPTHSSQFFPTPFLWPVSDFYIEGRSWGTPEIFIPNVIFLVAIYFWYFIIRKKRLAKRTASLHGEKK
ncbi:MAG: hypothetical protein AAB545_02915 [Patescibacteria group bacterium]